MEPVLTLYDIATAVAKPYSPKTWQIRLALNYKQLPFKTVWLNLVDLKRTLQGIGAEPTFFPWEPEGVYTAPVLVDESNPRSPIVVSHSLPIAEYLDSKYPDRPLFPEGSKAFLALLDVYINEKIQPLFFPLLVPQTYASLVARDKVYFRQTRERWLGCKLEEMSPTGAIREEQWEKLKEGLNALARLLGKNGRGKILVLGDMVSRGDFMLIGLFVWMAKLAPDEWERVKTWDGGRWGKLWEMSEVWRLNEA